ncbi:MAG: YihY/virulence factor BrkB family protein [Clostridiales bacterium]|nr:YihY/virulence factor BrkB family protein [Clostridiales bacterium]
MRRSREDGVIAFIWRVADLYFAKRVSRSAAALTYFLILSFFPALICINAVIGTLHVSIDTLLEELAGIIPAQAVGVLQEYVGYISGNQSRALLWAGAVMLLVMASAAMRILMTAMDDIYERRAYTGIWQIVASVAFSVLFLLTIYLSLVVVLTGNWFFHLLDGLIHRIPRLQNVVLPWEWQWMRFLILFCLVLVFVMVLYRATSPRGRSAAPVLVGALAASATLVGASAIFSVLIGMSSRYSLIYGSLASVIILLVWLYLCGNIVILGNVINRVWYSRRRAKLIRAEEEDRRRWRS